MSNGHVQTTSKTLVLCFDGTHGQYNDENTNVVKFFSLLQKTDPGKQVCYYQAGIGTFLKPGVVSPLFQWIAQILDEGIAWYLDTHVMDGFKFLMQNYNAGDKICLFGFSRGAYTARALGGMLYKVGLLGKDNDDQVPFAYKLFKRTDPASVTLSAGFKQTFCLDVKITFMGVWDTVASVGIVSGRSLPFVDSNKAITTFRQALSLDEHRSKFRPNFYHRPTPGNNSPTLNPEHPPPPLPSSVNGLADSTEEGSHGLTRFPSNGNASHSKSVNTTARVNGKVVEDGAPTDVLEVWFSGCHSDVGGGAVADDVKYSLSQVTLRWMVRQVVTSKCGILFNDAELAQLLIPPVSMPPATSTTAGPEELQKDSLDAGQPIHDDLVIHPIWWLLEIVPLHYTWQDVKNMWHTNYTIHMGKGRYVSGANPNFHVTVKARMNDANLKYKPKAIWTPGTEVYVE